LMFEEKEVIQLLPLPLWIIKISSSGHTP
jgi:hypothetical protein